MQLKKNKTALNILIWNVLQETLLNEKNQHAFMHALNEKNHAMHFKVCNLCMKKKNE